MARKNKIIIYAPNIGQDRIEEIINSTNAKGDYLPPSIKMEDLDVSVFDYFSVGEGKFVVPSKDDVVPLVTLENEEWAEFARTWQTSDDSRNPNFPLMTFRRASAPQRGTNFLSKFNFPTGIDFTYTKVPRVEAGYVFFDIYKIPQPVAVDIQYELRMFSYHIQDVNETDKKILTLFKSAQLYITVKNHFMPLYLDSIDKNDSFAEGATDKYRMHTYLFTLRGYIQDEETFTREESIKVASIGITEN